MKSQNRPNNGVVTHIPQWVPTWIPVAPDQKRELGYSCTHWLENGNGYCNATVLRLEDAIGDHACVVRSKQEQATNIIWNTTGALALLGFLFWLMFWI